MKYQILNIVDTKKIKTRTLIAWYSIISTWFYIGKLPISGTCGAIASYPLYYLVLTNANSLYDMKSKLLAIIILFSVISAFAIKKFQKITNTYDHKYVVIDEVIGQLTTIYISLEWIYNLAKIIALPINITTNIQIFLIALVPFRYFDIKKPSIIYYIHKKCKGSFGVIFDDILAAIFASSAIFLANIMAITIHREIL